MQNNLLLFPLFLSESLEAIYSGESVIPIDTSLTANSERYIRNINDKIEILLDRFAEESEKRKELKLLGHIDSVSTWKVF